MATACLKRWRSNPGDAAIIKASIELGHGFKLDLTAEGIETTSELRLLRMLGIDHGQGYLLGRPGPLEAHLN